MIGAAFDFLHTLVRDTLNTYGATLTPTDAFVELDDNIVIENNDEKKLKHGYCIEFLSDNIGTLSEISCNTQIEQLVRVTVTTSNFGTIRDIPLRKAAEKKLLGAKDSIVAAIGGNPQLNDTIARCIYEGSDPIELIIDESEKVFLMKRITLRLGYYIQDAQ